MPKYEIVQATEDHVAELAPAMRGADAREIWASSRRTPKEALDLSLAVSRDTARAGLVDGRTVCMFGVARGTFLSPCASPWLLASDELPKHARAFLRMSREYVQRLRQEYVELSNFVDARNVYAVKWLRWLGFTVEPAVPYGPDQIAFHPFRMRRDS